MRIIKQFNLKEFVFDNLRDQSNILYITIEDDILKIDFNQIIDTQFSGGNVQLKFNDYKDLLNLGHYSKAECGGFVNFFKVASDKGNEYILYSGVNEVSNSHLVVTIHKILAN
jgi:hypothetical protein